jgi:molybdopterin-biosynthesis enzyme MoeA-like protein
MTTTLKEYEEKLKMDVAKRLKTQKASESEIRQQLNEAEERFQTLK